MVEWIGLLEVLGQMEAEQSVIGRKDYYHRQLQRLKWRQQWWTH
jgi:hypothetical protein